MSVYHYLTVSAILFALGTYGVLTRAQRDRHLHVHRADAELRST